MTSSHTLADHHSAAAHKVLTILADNCEEISCRDIEFSALDLYRRGDNIEYIVVWGNDSAPKVSWALSDNGMRLFGLTANDDIDPTLTRHCVVPQPPGRITVFDNSIDPAGFAICIARPDSSPQVIAHAEFWRHTAARVASLADDTLGPGNACRIEFEHLSSSEMSQVAQVAWPVFCADWSADIQAAKETVPERQS